LGACGGGEKEPATTESTPAPAATGGGTVTGAVTFTGTDPDTPIAMNADPICASLHPTPVDTGKVAVKDGKLANVFVYVKTGLEGKTFPMPGTKKELDQVGCLYSPRVQGIYVGQPLVIKNTDSTLHNVHALPANNTEFNQGQPQGLPPFERTFANPEVMVRFKCDVHPWMTAWVGVLPHSFYAVSGEDGSYSIPNLPPGKYTLEAWHEELGTKTLDVDVTDGGTATASFDFSG
jgi:hypothetical protein